MKKFKDGLPKYYNVTLNFYIVVLFILLIIKLMGFDYFVIDVDNKTINDINTFIIKNNLVIIFQILITYIQLKYILNILTANDTNKLYALFISLCVLILQIILNLWELMMIYSFFNMLLMFVLIKVKYKNLKSSKIIKFFMFVYLIQIASMIIRNVNYFETSYIINLILSIDYLIYLSILNFITIKGGGLWQVGTGYQASLYLIICQKLKNMYTNFLNSFLKNINIYKKLPKTEKIAFWIYNPIALIYNFIILIIIIFVATLNDTVIECLFILIAFMSTKTAFGKAFHFNSAKLCFIVSNLSYYALNRITTPIGISILVPIILGISLSYATSFLVKEKFSTKLYRGMSEELFEELILKVIDKNSTYYNVCKDFYINKYSELKLANKYHYTINGIKKIKTKIRDKLKEL